MKKIMIAAMLVLNINAIAQNNAYSVSIDPDDGGKIFNGPVTFADLEKETTFSWLKQGKDEYTPDAAAMGKLGALHNYTMVVFLGTWCDDSHNLIPRLDKVLQLNGYPMDKLAMYGVDHEKKTKNGEQKKYGITNVPTIILFDFGGKEAGRITESVRRSIEEDLAAIISGDQQPQPK
jgi:thiol-disulfide isomerase/thioredoxin